MNPKIAVVILNWNGKKFLELFLPSVAATTYPGAEIWIADNASSDDSVEFVREKFPSVHILELQENHGFAGGYNLALEQIRKQSDAKYFVLLNQDVEVENDWIDPVVKKMEADSTIGAAQPKLKMEADRKMFEYAGAAGGMMDSLCYPFCRGRIFDSLEDDHGQYEEIAEIAWASGAALFIRADLYSALGGLDPDFFAHMEEIDLCWRVRRAGYKIIYVPEATVYHVGGGSLEKTNPRKTYLNFRNNMRMLIKNENSIRLLWLLPLRSALDITAALKELASGKSGHALAIIRGSSSALTGLRYWIKRRRQDRKKIVANRIGKDRSREAGWYSGSILIQYFLQGKKYWNEF